MKHVAHFFENEVTIRIIKWIIFGVILALAPIGFDYLNQATHVDAPRFTEVISKGELALVCAGIAGAAIGELIGSGKDLLALKMISGGGSVVIVLVAAAWYAQIASDARAGAPYNKDTVASYSIWLLFFTIVSSIGCMLTSGEASK